MKLAWVTHHLPRDTDSPAGYHLPGRFVGGAEMTDQAYIDAAPTGVAIQRLGPDEWEQALDADDIVITGTDLLSEQAMLTLAERRPVVFLHHAQTRTPARRVLLNTCRTMLVHTPAHLWHELNWVDPPIRQLVLSPMDPTECTVAVKERFALWANRMHPLKGPLAAKMWAVEHDMPLVMLSTSPRNDVLEVMSRAEVFVHLPQALESESRATIEAVLSGCRVVANDNVGITSVDKWRDRGWLADQVATAGTRFWELVL